MKRKPDWLPDFPVQTYCIPYKPQQTTKRTGNTTHCSRSVESAAGCITQTQMICRHWEASINSMHKFKRMLKGLLDCRVQGEE